MPKFTVGEKVVCINSTKDKSLEEGRLYIVTKVEGDFIVIKGFNRFFNSDYFTNINKEMYCNSDANIHREQLEFVANLAKVDLEIVKKVLEANLVYLHYTIDTKNL